MVWCDRINKDKGWCGEDVSDGVKEKTEDGVKTLSVLRLGERVHLLACWVPTNKKAGCGGEGRRAREE